MLSLKQPPKKAQNSLLMEKLLEFMPNAFVDKRVLGGFIV